ncbi:MAG: hypothetical protein JWN70_6087 [Planctomycetaceae bacterium]|nr:hypothetical protein [Planctomycetaceae bacterium]
MAQRLFRNLAFGVMFAAFACLTVQAAEPSRPVAQQIREFEIIVDDSRAGTNRVVTSDYAGGRTVTTTEANVSINYLVYTYTYRFRGSESWLASRPRKIECQTLEGGKRRSVKALIDPEAMDVAVDTNPHRKLPAAHLTTNFWYWPAELDQQDIITVLDVDNGQSLQMRTEKIGIEHLRCGSQTLKCTHYRLDGEASIDLWFDEQRQLVQKKCVEDGHPTELRLTTIKQVDLAAKPAARSQASTNR